MADVTARSLQYEYKAVSTVVNVHKSIYSSIINAQVTNTKYL